MKQFKRIPIPMFRIGRYKLNEYELRTLMLDIAEGNQQEFIGRKVTDCMSGNSAIIDNGGALIDVVAGNKMEGLQFAAKLALNRMDIKNK